MNDNRGTIALARRLYLHLQSGAQITAEDMGRIVEGMERTDAELDALRQEYKRMAERYAGALKDVVDLSQDRDRLAAALEKADALAKVAQDLIDAIPTKLADEGQKALDAYQEARRER